MPTQDAFLLPSGVVAGHRTKQQGALTLCWWKHPGDLVALVSMRQPPGCLKPEVGGSDVETGASLKITLLPVDQ